jgi:hypothetical protein
VLPAIAVSAFSREEDKIHSRFLGYQAHIIKPFHAFRMDGALFREDVLRWGRADIVHTLRHSPTDVTCTAASDPSGVEIRQSCAHRGAWRGYIGRQLSGQLPVRVQ